jgi:hypothetical protein
VWCLSFPEVLLERRRVPGSPLIEDGADGSEGQRMATAGESQVSPTW